MKNALLLFSLISFFSGIANAQQQLIVAQKAKEDAAESVKSCIHEQYDLVQTIVPIMKKVRAENLKLHQCKMQEGLLPFYDGSFKVLSDVFKNRNFDNLEHLNKAFVPYFKFEDGYLGWDFPQLEMFSSEEILEMALDFNKKQQTMIGLKEYYSKKERFTEKNYSYYPEQKLLSKISTCSEEFGDLILAEKNLRILLKQQP